jgi:type II secretory pathway component GspD/PulD (secretin)
MQLNPGASQGQERRHAWVRSVHVALGIGGLAFLLDGCLAPRKGYDSRGKTTSAEVARRLGEGGATPVFGELGEGQALESESSALADPLDPQVKKKLDEFRQHSASQPQEDSLVESPYLRFGERIILRSQGDETYITKPYSMPAGRGEKVLELMAALDPFPFRQRRAAGAEVPPLQSDIVEYELLAGWDEEFYNNFQEPVPTEAKSVVLSDILVITATYSRLENFEDFLDLFASAGIPQIELEAKIIEITESETLDVGLDSSFIFGTGNFVKELDFNLPNLTSGSEAIAVLGALQDGVTFNAVLQLIQNFDNVQIDSQPKTVVRAGGVASIDSTVDIPFYELRTITPTGNTGTVVYKKVGTQLFISPRVIGTKTLALEVHLIGSQQTGSTLVAIVEGEALMAPQIAYRTAKTVVYLEPGQTLVIGGLSQNREREIVSKVPILGDIPLLGYLFRSTFKQREKQTVLFAISPRIIQSADFETDL